MNYAGVEVLDPGLHSLLLSGGDQQNQHQGVSPSGPMDEAAFISANLLVDNIAHSTSFTMELMGTARFRVIKDALFAVAGPNVEVLLDSVVIASWQSFYAPADSEIIIRPSDNKWAGQRSYLAVRGGFISALNDPIQPKPIQLNSIQSNLDQRKRPRGKPKAIRSGDIIRATHNIGASIRKNESKLPCPDYSLNKPIRVITGYQADKMTSLALAQFFSQEYTLSAMSNRMGYRLEGTSLPAIKGGMYSEGLHTGAIQIPPNGKPIVMLADRQTLGGYPKIGAIARVDLPRFVQASTNQTLNFEPTDVYSARNAWRLMYQRWTS